MSKNHNTLKIGDYNAICDRCGFKFKASELQKEWTGFYVCKDCWDPRHPQDFIKSKKDSQKLSFTRPPSPQTFVTLVEVGGQSTNTNFQYTNGTPSSYTRFNTVTLTYETSNFFTGFESIVSK